MLFHSKKQHVIISQLVSSNLIPSPLPFRLNLRIFTNTIKYLSITIVSLKRQACITVPHLIQLLFFFGWYEKRLLNFVSERIKLVHKINNTRLAFQTSKTTIYRPQTSELKSISKLQLLFSWKNRLR